MAAQDDTTRLEEVVVEAFQRQVKWKESTAAVAVINQKTIGQFSPVSLLPAMNTIAGVRMEERSPGSYRLAIRGNLLRSPFGVRNIKIYYNGLPQTDASGNSYFNLMDLSLIERIELMKGPASSNYGVGTSGALLIENDLKFLNEKKQYYQLGLTAGSFGLLHTQASLKSSKVNSASAIQFNHTETNGYREQTALNRTGLQWQTKWKSANNIIWQTMLWYTRLQYQTPGGLTEAQMQQNPQQARPPAGSLPGAVAQKAGVYNETIQAAIQLKKNLSSRTLLNSFIQLSYTSFKNPFITNYEVRKENNVNMGLNIDWQVFKNNPSVHWQNGFEYLVNESGIENFENKQGNKGGLLNNDIVYSTQGFLFSQLHYSTGKKWNLYLGVSSNLQRYHYRRLSTPNSIFNTRNITAPFLPRLSAGYAVAKDIQLYAILSRGFSFPSLAEVRPSDGNFYPFLLPENGWNTELGLKGFIFDHLFKFDLNFYRFVLQDAIVRKTDAAGAEYFVNAGSLVQQGIEASVEYRQGVVSWTNSYSFQPYRFQIYSSGATDYAGNKVTGVAGSIFYSGISVDGRKGLYGNLSVNATGAIPLNDANTVWANGYQLVQLKFGKRLTIQRLKFNMFAGCDNLLNQRYSLGNDINAAGNRFFNPAPARNIYIGLILQSNN